MDKRVSAGQLTLVPSVSGKPPSSEAGFTSVQFLLGSAIALVFFLALANLVVVQFAAGALRSALDQGVRAGSIARSASVCELRVSEVLEDLLSGTIGETTDIKCEIDGLFVAAEGSLVVESWTIFTGDYSVSLTAEASLENDAG